MTDIQAAGGVVWRPSDSGVEIALVHRPRYDDWSLPKGKLDRGETQLMAAVREIGEEIGARVRVERWLGEISYRTNGRGIKTVAYWSMRYLDGPFVPSAEVDELAWVPPLAARRLLSYDIDADVLTAFENIPVPDAVVVLVRHARAGKRSTWSGEDTLRPLDSVGQAQARRLAAMLPYFGVDTVRTADLVRCEQTLLPLAEALGQPVQSEHVFADDACAQDVEATVAAVVAAGADGAIAAICSQGYTIPTVIESMFGEDLDSRTRKAGFWTIGFADGAPVSADYYEDAIRPFPR